MDWIPLSKISLKIVIEITIATKKCPTTRDPDYIYTCQSHKPKNAKRIDIDYKKTITLNIQSRNDLNISRSPKDNNVKSNASNNNSNQKNQNFQIYHFVTITRLNAIIRNSI